MLDPRVKLLILVLINVVVFVSPDLHTEWLCMGMKIGGTDVREMTCDSLLRYVSMVFQRVYLFHDTIENNIRFGSPDAAREEIIGNRGHTAKTAEHLRKESYESQ
ncbi:MAG: hypothetical protein LBB94_02215 [Clostridiales bacterium]|jgi:ABC-type phosphate transport system ATPase subunit|nr:hypothetical protein [Clostridiales bacterium]